MAQENPSNYVELSTQAYSLFTDAFASANQRALEYYKSLYQIATRPYASTAVESAARENLDRANQIMSVTVDELQTSGQKTADFAQKLVAHGAKVQETYVATLRGLANAGVSNMNFVRETAERQVDDFAKRVDDIRTTATASKN